CRRAARSARTRTRGASRGDAALREEGARRAPFGDVLETVQERTPRGVARDEIRRDLAPALVCEPELGVRALGRHVEDEAREGPFFAGLAEPGGGGGGREREAAEAVDRVAVEEPELSAAGDLGDVLGPPLREPRRQRDEGEELPRRDRDLDAMDEF